MHTSSGIRSAVYFNRVLDIGSRMAPLNQRLITDGISTAGVPLSDLEPQDIDELPDMNADGSFDQFREAAPAPSHNQPQMTWDFSFNPLNLVIRAVVLPVFGAVDFAIQKAAPVVYTVVSLVYQSLPLTNLVRFSRVVRIIRKTPLYDYSKAAFKEEEDECLTCGYVGRHYTRRRLKGQPEQSIPIRCEHIMQKARYRAPPGAYSDIIVFPPNPFNDPELENIKLPPQTFERFDKQQDLRSRIKRLLQIRAFKGCPHPIPDSTLIKPRAFVPEPTVDGLYELPPSKVWRKEDRCHGIRCTHCFPDSIHSWDPELIYAIRNFDILKVVPTITPDDYEGWHVILRTALVLTSFMRKNFRAGEEYVLTSVTQSRVGQYQLCEEHPAHVVLVDSDATMDKLVARYPLLAASDRCFIIKLPIHGTESSFGSWRLLVAALCPVDCGFLVLNQRLSYYEPLAAHVVFQHKRSWSSCSPGHVYPFYMGCAYIRGATSLLNLMEYTYLFYAVGFCYGFDEVVPALWERTTVMIVSDPGLPEVMAPLVSRQFTKGCLPLFLLLDSSGAIIDSYQADFSRENIYIMKALGSGYIDQGRVTIAHAFADLRPISKASVSPDLKEYLWYEVAPEHPRFAPSSAAGENIINEISNTHGGVIFFTFGSRGDRNPVMANCRYLASLGAKVTVVHLNTESEGKMLADMETGDDWAKTRLFLRAREYLAGYSGMAIIAPHQLFYLAGLSYTLAPPEDIIHPFVSSNNVVLSVCYSLLGSLYQANFRIGAFATSKTLPTSADGENFMVATLNRAKPGTTKAWWGGDGKPVPGWEHIPLLEPGDHSKTMPEVETLITKGTVGTVALGALSGCKVVALGSGLDREYRNPYDAGQGFVDGQNPDRIFLALGALRPAYYGVWLRSNWYNLSELWAWFGPEGVGLSCFRLIMLYLYLTKLQKFSFLSTTPITTLVLMLDGRSTVPLRTYLFYLLIAKTFDTILKVLSKNYLWLTQHFVSLNSRMMSSAIAFWVAQTRGWFWGLVVAQGTKILEPVLYWLVNWVPITLGANPDEPLVDDEYAVLEFVLVYRVIPVVHTALVFRRAGLRVEGRVNAFGLYQATAVQGDFHSPFVFPTRIRLSYIRSRLNRVKALPYGPTWHCYSVIWDLVGQASPRLGVGAVVYWFVLGVSSVLSTLSIAALGLSYTILTTIPAIGGVSTRSVGVVSMISSAIRSTIDMVETARGDYLHLVNTWFARFTFLAPIPQWLYH